MLTAPTLRPTGTLAARRDGHADADQHGHRVF